VLVVMAWSATSAAQVAASSAPSSASQVSHDPEASSIVAATRGTLDLQFSTSILPATADHPVSCPDSGPECNGPNPPGPYRHHIKALLSESNLEAAYGLSSWAVLEARLSLRVLDMKPHYLELDGTPKEVPNDIHHKDETLVGPTDPWLMVRFTKAFGRFVPAVRVGFSIPLGSTVEDPIVLTQMGLEHQHVQFGTGVFGPIFGASGTYIGQGFELTGGVHAMPVVFENDEGYRGPTRIYTTSRASADVPSLRLRPFLGVEHVYDGPDHWKGTTDADSFVVSDILVGGGVDWAFMPYWQLGVTLRVVAVTFRDTIIDYPGSLAFSVGTRIE
jgi:hypothetical protein